MGVTNLVEDQTDEHAARIARCVVHIRVDAGRCACMHAAHACCMRAAVHAYVCVHLGNAELVRPSERSN